MSESVEMTSNSAPNKEEETSSGGSKSSCMDMLGCIGLGIMTTTPDGMCMKAELKSWNLWRGVIGEFTATLLFLYVTIGTIVTVESLLQVALAFGLTITILVYIFANVSGANINPAVSLMLVLTKRMTPLRGVLYIIAQCLGATCGSLIVKALTHEDYWGAGCNEVFPSTTYAGALFYEIFSTSLLLLTVQAAIDSKQSEMAPHIGNLAPLAIGLAVFLAHLVNIPKTNTSINPARTLGAAIAINEDRCWEDQEIFWIGPFLSSILSAILYQVCFKQK